MEKTADLASGDAPAPVETETGLWMLVGLLIDEGAWRIAVEGLDGDVVPVAIVLKGRASGAEHEVPVDVADGVVRAEVAVADLVAFGPEVVDLSVRVDAAGRDVLLRVACTGPLDELLSGPASDAARWYVTKYGNLSVRLAPPLSSGQVRPTLTRASFDDGRWLLKIEGAGIAPDPLLVVRGRVRTKITLTAPLHRVMDGWEATIGPEEFRPLGGDVVDLFVAEQADPTTIVRVAAGEDLDGTRSPDSFTPYTTRRGMASFRRKGAAEVIRDSGTFDEAFYLAQEPDLESDEDLVDHYVRTGAAQGLDPSAMFDTRYYRRAHPDTRAINPLAHYSEFGWKELRNPSQRFDTWWYWSKHLDLTDESTAPLAHYEQVGKHENLSTRPQRPPSRWMGAEHRVPTDRPVRRVCLLAAYDAHGIVDDYVVDYVRELSRFADVYYLADSEMPEAELAKLDGITRGAWAQPHGEYDFGSYKRLAERVGWDVLETYDELLLVNDSCYLLRPLDEVFARMDGRACDWWGLQASTRKHASWDPHRAPIPHAALDVLVDRVEARQLDVVHVSSYFVAFRSPVIQDPEFRRYLGLVTRQAVKSNVILRYEIGLSRWLVHHGHRFDTFARDIYPYHPVYNGWYFRLLDQGFPLLKRQLLSTNPLGVDNLAAWKERVLAKVPGADVEMFERNLRRVVDAATLADTVDDVSGIPPTTDAPTTAELLSDDDFRRADRRAAQQPERWVFPVDPATHALGGHVRAVFERVKDDPTIHKSVLRRERAVDVGGVNVEVVELASPAGQQSLLRAGTILVDVDLRAEVVHPVSGEFHNIVRLGSSGRDRRLEVTPETVDATVEEDVRYRALVSSSKVETLALTASSYPMTYHQVWSTGSPRTDFILADESDLPADLAAELADLRSRTDGRRLLLVVTEDDRAPGSSFTSEQLDQVRAWLAEHGCVLGVHSRAVARGAAHAVATGDIAFLDVSHVTHPEVLYREATALVTDVSGAFVDFLVTGRPVLTFVPAGTPDLEERITDLEDVFPGPVTRTFDEVWAALDGLLAEGHDATYTFKRRLFHDHLDGASAVRAVERIRDLTEVHGVGKPFGERMA